jgi:hypothetical protein
MSLDMLKKKRKADKAFESEYDVYGIVLTDKKATLTTLFFRFMLYASLTS